jgi:STE24 endopeptidase
MKFGGETSVTSDSVPAAEASGERPDASVVASAEPADDLVMTPQQLAEARQYGRLELYCGLIDRAVDVAYLALFAWLAARPLDQWLQGSPLLHWGSVRLAVFYLLMTIVHVCVSFPLSYYSGHVLEHRFGMSRQTFGRWLWRYLKRNLLALLFGIFVVEGLFWTIWLTGPLWWLVAAGVFFVVSIIIGQLAPVLILPLFYKIRPLEDVELKDRLAQLAEGTGLSLEGVYRMEMSSETAKANAMLAGLGRTRRVILGDTLLDQFSPAEIEVIFAHEIGIETGQRPPASPIPGPAPR